MDLTLTISVPLIAAVLAAEAISFVFYSLVHRHDLGDRYLAAGLVADVVLAFLLQHIQKKYWSVSRWEDSAVLSAWLALLFACLEAPHAVWNQRSFSRFFVHVLHKLIIMFAMNFTMVMVKNY